MPTVAESEITQNTAEPGGLTDISLSSLLLSARRDTLFGCNFIFTKNLLLITLTRKQVDSRILKAVAQLTEQEFQTAIPSRGAHSPILMTEILQAAVAKHISTETQRQLGLIKNVYDSLAAPSEKLAYFADRVYRLVVNARFIILSLKTSDYFLCQQPEEPLPEQPKRIITWNAADDLKIKQILWNFSQGTWDEGLIRSISKELITATRVTKWFLLTLSHHPEKFPDILEKFFDSSICSNKLFRELFTIKPLSIFIVSAITRFLSAHSQTKQQYTGYIDILINFGLKYGIPANLEKGENYFSFAYVPPPQTIPFLHFLQNNPFLLKENFTKILTTLISSGTFGHSPDSIKHAILCFTIHFGGLFQKDPCIFLTIESSIKEPIPPGDEAYQMQRLSFSYSAPKPLSSDDLTAVKQLLEEHKNSLFARQATTTDGIPLQDIPPPGKRPWLDYLQQLPGVNLASSVLTPQQFIFLNSLLNDNARPDLVARINASLTIPDKNLLQLIFSWMFNTENEALALLCLNAIEAVFTEPNFMKNTACVKIAFDTLVNYLKKCDPVQFESARLKERIRRLEKSYPIFATQGGELVKKLAKGLDAVTYPIFWLLTFLKSEDISTLINATYGNTPFFKQLFLAFSIKRLSQETLEILAAIMQKIAALPIFSAQAATPHSLNVFLYLKQLENKNIYPETFAQFIALCLENFPHLINQKTADGTFVMGQEFTPLQICAIRVFIRYMSWAEIKTDILPLSETALMRTLIDKVAIGRIETQKHPLGPTQLNNLQELVKICAAAIDQKQGEEPSPLELLMQLISSLPKQKSFQLTAAQHPFLQLLECMLQNVHYLDSKNIFWQQFAALQSANPSIYAVISLLLQQRNFLPSYDAVRKENAALKQQLLPEESLETTQNQARA